MIWLDQALRQKSSTTLQVARNFTRTTDKSIWGSTRPEFGKTDGKISAINDQSQPCRLPAAVSATFMTISRAVALLAISLTCVGDTHSATPEYEVKAANLFNFTRFFEWPSYETDMKVCIYGKDPFGEFLDEVVRNKLAHGHPVTIRRLGKEQESVDECQLLFVGITSPTRTAAVLARVQGRSIVTVGESDSFIEAGGMMRLVVDDGRVRFDINLVAITAAHLKISARLGALGRTIKK